jgi:hypothetical protein
VSVGAAALTASAPAMASGGIPGGEYLVPGAMMLTFGAASIGFSVTNLVSVAERQRSSGMTLGLSYAAGGLTVIGGAWLLAESSIRDESEVSYVGGAGMALGALSIAAAVWAHRQPETPRSAQWALTPWVAPGARGERMLGAVLTLRAW